MLTLPRCIPVALTPIAAFARQPHRLAGRAGTSALHDCPCGAGPARRASTVLRPVRCRAERRRKQ
ncbi:hypothetical protein CHELA40_11260 [Chelatococcus asaccharovorans]|nr:hypothetical protein CHELA40_11260 [Chelatococcus asaccharovorans]